MERLKILLNSNQINQKTFDFLEKLNNKVFDWSQTDKERFLTHTAIAMTRIQKQEKVDSLSNFVIDQIIENPKYKKACIFLEFLFEGVGLLIPVNEKHYLLLHILNYVK